MNAEYFEKLMEWQKGNIKSRSLSIEIGPSNPCRIWVFDIDLGVGQFLENGVMPNLELKAEKEARAEYERLKAKFEGEK